jgi:hypothetical protein
VPIRHAGTRWDEWSASRPGRVLPPGKDLLYPLYRRLGGPQELVWIQRLEEKNPSPLSMIESRQYSLYSRIILTELHHLLKTLSIK